MINQILSKIVSIMEEPTRVPDIQPAIFRFALNETGDGLLLETEAAPRHDHPEILGYPLHMAFPASIELETSDGLELAYVNDYDDFLMVENWEKHAYTRFDIDPKPGRGRLPYVGEHPLLKGHAIQALTINPDFNHRMQNKGITRMGNDEPRSKLRLGVKP